MPIHENYVLYMNDENFVIQPTPNVLEESLIIDRVTNETKLSNRGIVLSEANYSQLFCHGVLGAIHLISGYYLVIITKKHKVGQLIENDIYKLDEVKIIPYRESQKDLSESEIRYSNYCREMIESVLRTQYFYFSYTYDLTHSLQQLQNTTPEFMSQSIYERANMKFVWNSHLINNLNPKREFRNFLLPLIHGYVSVNEIHVSGKFIELALISRRSIHNAGTRFNVRGTDNEGNTANFIETEQIILTEDYRCSYVQIRGSIPLFWSQKPNLKYKPSMVINESRNHLEAFQKHIDSIQKQYENQVMINLVNQHGSEGKLEKTFFDAFKSMNNSSLRYEAFDFHKQCGNDRWDRLSILINRLANDQDTFGYFCLNKSGNVLSTQKGVFRTNCIDCLDRTNVVQSLLAKRILQVQLIRMNVISESVSIESNKELYETFRRIWAENGDLLSIQYAGTGALKSDFTRTGQRTTYGMLKDGVNSLHRYYLNNFSDGYRQDSIDLLLGNCKASLDAFKSLEQTKADINSRKYLVIPFFGLATFSMFIISLMIPAETYQEQLTYVLFWGFASMCCLATMVYFGNEFVNMPILSNEKNKKEL